MLSESVDTSAVLKMQGSFIGIGNEHLSGQAKIFLQKNKYFLMFENFSSSTGPDLKVYLSQKPEPASFINLGDLKSTNGNQVYEILDKPDVTKYRFVLIHCEKYNHLYGSAELK